MLLMRLLVLTALMGLYSRHLHAESWPEFRGPNGNGHAPGSGYPLTWSESHNVTWKTPIPGRGWSSPVVDGEQIWLTTAIETEASAEEAKQRLAKNTGGQPLTVLSTLELHAVCVDARSGKLRHDIKLLDEKAPQWVHQVNSYASPTPVLASGKLFCHFGTFGTVCLDTKTAEIVWTNRKHRIMHENGPGSSPIRWKNKLIFHCDGSDVQYIVALETATGKEAWKTNRSGTLRDDVQLRKSYATPQVVEVGGRPQLISPAADWLYAYDPETGKEFWKLNYGVLGFSIAPRPLFGHGMIYTCTSFMQPELLAIRYDGQDGKTKPHIAWRSNKGAPSMPSPLLVGDEIYMVSDNGGVVTCLDAHTGKENWRERVGGNYSASPLFADGRIYFFSREGTATVIAPGKEYKLLASNTLEGMLMASPAVIDNALLLRSNKALYRVETK
jgi:outer membrane protein assembly factor BamB